MFTEEAIRGKESIVGRVLSLRFLPADFLRTYQSRVQDTSRNPFFSAAQTEYQSPERIDINRYGVLRNFVLTSKRNSSAVRFFFAKAAPPRLCASHQQFLRQMQLQGLVLRKVYRCRPLLLRAEAGTVGALGISLWVIWFPVCCLASSSFLITQQH